MLVLVFADTETWTLCGVADLGRVRAYRSVAFNYRVMRVTCISTRGVVRGVKRNSWGRGQDSGGGGGYINKD